MLKMRTLFISLLIVLFSCAVSPTSYAQAANSPVLQLENWRQAVLSGDANALHSMYTDTARILGPKKTTADVKSAVEYWSSWKTKGLKSISAEVQSQQEPQPGFHVLNIQLTLAILENGATKKYYESIGQGYIEQEGTWKIAAENRESATRLKPPAERKDLYPADADANKEITEALSAAAKSHKRVLLIFGGNWCYDCHVLDEAFHSPEIAPTLNRNFVVVHIDRLYAVEPRFDMMSDGADVVVVPILFVQQLVGFGARIIHHFAASVFLPETAPIAIAHVDLIAGHIIEVFWRDPDANAGVIAD